MGSLAGSYRQNLSAQCSPQIRWITCLALRTKDHHSLTEPGRPLAAPPFWAQSQFQGTIPLWNSPYQWPAQHPKAQLPLTLPLRNDQRVAGSTTIRALPSAPVWASGPHGADPNQSLAVYLPHEIPPRRFRTSTTEKPRPKDRGFSYR